jgi:hypothetical protein
MKFVISIKPQKLSDPKKENSFASRISLKAGGINPHHFTSSLARSKQP